MNVWHCVLNGLAINYNSKGLPRRILCNVIENCWIIAYINCRSCIRATLLNDVQIFPFNIELDKKNQKSLFFNKLRFLITLCRIPTYQPLYFTLSCTHLNCMYNTQVTVKTIGPLVLKNTLVSILKWAKLYCFMSR